MSELLWLGFKDLICHGVQIFEIKKLYIYSYYSRELYVIYDTQKHVMFEMIHKGLSTNEQQHSMRK